MLTVEEEHVRCDLKPNLVDVFALSHVLFDANRWLSDLGGGTFFTPKYEFQLKSPWAGLPVAIKPSWLGSTTRLRTKPYGIFTSRTKFRKVSSRGVSMMTILTGPVPSTLRSTSSSSLRTCWIVVFAAFGSMIHAQTAPAPEQTPVPPAPPSAPEKPFDVSGYADLYYQFDTGKPPVGQTVNGRWYDQNHDSYRLSGIQVDISRTPTVPHPFGFFVSLLAGSNATVLASTEPGGINTYKDFSQAYVTYLVRSKIPITIDFGKWYAFVGYEGLDSRTQDNYSRSFTFTALEPDYMTGFRGTAVINAKLTVNAYLYQGYNEVKNSNSTTMTGAGATYAITDKLTATLQGYEGKESSSHLNESGSYGGIGFPTPGPSWVNQINPVLIYKPNSKDKFAFDGTYASATGKGNWNGEAVYYRRQFDSKNDCCLRIERADDRTGLRFLAGGIQLDSFTATYDYAATKNLLLRFEVRHDIASHAFFDSDSGATTQRTTFTFAQIIQF